MSQMQVRLSRYDAQPWGFRLQGGTDFGTPLVVQKVNAGSLSEQAGLLPGDQVLSINDVDVYALRHKEAQDLVVRSGNSFVVTILRGQSTWRPHVTPTGNLPNAQGGHLGNNIPTVTKTSLAHRRPQEEEHIGCGYNNAARPFNAVNGNGPVKSIVNKQYNSPVGIYSDESIAETLSAQAEVLAEGVLGVNFKKNEKQYNAEKSEVLKFLREAEHEPTESAYNNNNNHYENNHHQHEHQHQQQHQVQTQQHQHQQQHNSYSQQQSNTYQNSGPTKHVSAPVDQPRPQGTGGHSVGGQNICSECERLIVGVFVRIKDKNLHAECFRCATCGTSLKNQGYYNFNNKLYCDIHAKLAASQNPPSGTEGYEPVPIRPGTKLSANNISAALNAHGYQGIPASANVPVTYSQQHHQKYQQPQQQPQQQQQQQQQPQYHQPQQQQYPPQPKVNQPFTRPYGAGPASSHVPTASPKSPQIYPPSTQPQSWNQPRPAPQAQHSPYATLPRTNYGGNQQPQYQQHQQQGRPSYNTTQYNQPGHNIRGSNKGGAFGARSAPKRGYGTLNKAGSMRTPQCSSCGTMIRGPFITALGRIWCPDHFICVRQECHRPLQDIGFVEEKGDLYCEYCFEKHLAPSCNKCNGKIKGDCLNAIGKHFHPECFNCFYCGKLFGNTPFFLEEGNPYCEADWNELFTTKCFACGFPVEAGDRWVEALNHNYHSQCFNCTMCKKNLEGQSFYNKGGRPFCKNHAR